MDWKDVGAFVGKTAPLIGGLFGPAGVAIGGLVAAALGTENTPEAVMSHLQNNPDALIKLRELEMSHERELRRMTIEAATRELAEEVRAIQATNETYKTEIQSEDKYVSRWRPTMGYAVTAVWSLMGISLFAAFVAIIVMLFVNPTLATTMTPILGAAIADIFNAVNLMFVSAFAVLGVYVKKRSDDKVLSSSGEPVGFFDFLTKKIRK